MARQRLRLAKVMMAFTFACAHVDYLDYRSSIAICCYSYMS
jgi:hypothetical protein